MKKLILEALNRRRIVPGSFKRDPIVDHMGNGSVAIPTQTSLSYTYQSHDPVTDPHARNPATHSGMVTAIHTSTTSHLHIINSNPKGSGPQDASSAPRISGLGPHVMSAAKDLGSELYRRGVKQIRYETFDNDSKNAKLKSTLYRKAVDSAIKDMGAEGEVNHEYSMFGNSGKITRRKNL